MLKNPVRSSTDPTDPEGRLILAGILLAGLIIGGVLLHGSGGDGQDNTDTSVKSATTEKDLTPNGQGDRTAEEQVLELDLLLRATERTWLRIQADSSEPWETTMKAGDEIRLQAVDRVALFIGNAGGILFELNGKRFGPLGTRGQVISNYVITRDNL